MTMVSAEEGFRRLAIGDSMLLSALALIAVAASVGSPRVVAAAPRIALAAGYDVDAALEATGAAGS